MSGPSSTSGNGQADRLALATEIAWKAGKQTLSLFQNADLQVEKKSDRSPVTLADRNAETLLRNEIAAHYPDDAIVGEEFGKTEGSSGYRWILDPIDGTKSFISGVPLYGTMVGVELDGESVMGVVYLPGLDEGVYASKGQGAWHIQGSSPPVAAKVSTTDQLAECTFVTSEVSSFSERSAGAVFERLQHACYVTRTWGDCYGYLLVATGRVDLMIDPILNIWDAAAVQPILQEAGGRFTDWRGAPRIDSGDAIGSNGHIHDQVVEITHDYPAPS